MDSYTEQARLINEKDNIPDSLSTPIGVGMMIGIAEGLKKVNQ